jgi:hypothetical protein
MSEIRYAEGTTYLVIKGKKTWSSWELMGFHTRKT